MPWTPDDAERHTHKATTSALRSFGRRSQTNAWNEPATKVARSGKRTPSSRGRRKAPISQDSSPAVTPVTLSAARDNLPSSRRLAEPLGALLLFAGLWTALAGALA
jgi:hypothetical protein